ncbi:glycosyl transferase family 1 [Rhizobium sp. BK251]|nr:glycosyl transferase family 1 [Rhizobium sp. BK251]
MLANRLTPKISIVTPSLNQGRFLQDCLDSVAAQNWPDIEHFVIDGRSSDDTLDILERNRSRLTDYVSEPDKGAADAINKGLARCTGDIVAWLNADDFYLPGAFEKLAEAWRENPDAAFWFGNGVRVDEAGKIKSTFNARNVVYNHRALVEGLDYILQPSTFMNPNVLRKVGLLNTDLRWSFDWDLWLRLAKEASPATIDAQLSATREWEATLTASGGFRRTEELRLMAERYSGKPMTHGALCYWLDTMTGLMRNNPGAFHNKTFKAARQLWSAVQSDMQRLGVDASGMPIRAEGAFDLVVGIDLYPLTPGASGGIVPWVQGVLREMVRLYPSDRFIMFHRPGKAPLKVAGDNVEYVALNEHPQRFYEEMTRRCEDAGVDAVIRSYPQENHPDLPFEQQIFVIPDLQHEFFPEFFTSPVLAARRRAFAYALSKGGAIATMTEHSRSTVINNPWTLSQDVFLMPAALPEELRDDPAGGALPEKVKTFDRFFYMPANLWPHKNHRRLFDAFRRALPHLPAKTGLVLTGSPEGLEDAIKGYEDLPILHLGFVPHDQVAALFRDTVALVYFSLFEGFGIPLLEAFRYGTPVLCSNVASLPEVGGDAVLACDPTDADAMADLMRRIVSEPGLREDLSAKAVERLAAYNWTNPAHELHAALKRRASSINTPTRKPPLVSIVMPTRNHAHFIRDSIDSVLNQSYQNVELIVMDGASTDETVDILKSYGDKIRWISERDNGQADAINKGMVLAKGEVLAYLNSDDVFLPRALERVVKYFAEYPECDLVYGNADYIDKDGNITGVYTTAEFSFDRLMHDCCICQPAAFWRRRIAERTGPFNAELQTAMDYEYWLRIASSGGIIHHTAEKLAQSRLHEDAKTLAMRGKIFEEVFKICQQHGGYVSFNYYQGLWHYRLCESWAGGTKLAQIVPGFYGLPALAHFSVQLWRLGRNRQSRQYVARTAFSIVDRRAHLLSTAIRKARRYSSRLRRSFG